MGKIVTIFELGIERVHMYKDVFLTGYYLAKDLGRDAKECELWAPSNMDLSVFARGGKHEPFIGCTNVEREIIRRLELEAMNIDVLVLFHSRPTNAAFISAYKKKNKCGKVYVKLDYNPDKEQNKIIKGRNPIKNLIRKIKYMCYVSKVDAYSVETERGYKHLLQNKYFSRDISDKLVLMPNGYDDDLITSTMPLKESEKSNIIITVGRIGSEEKNNEMLLRAIDNIDLKDWKVEFIGPYTDDFKELVAKNSNVDAIDLIGNIDDKQILYGYYNKAKVFVFTSIYESYGLVLNEAVAFCNYIISTDVGAARDIIKNSKIGRVIDVNDVSALEKLLKDIIGGVIDLDMAYDNILSVRASLSSEALIKTVSGKLDMRTNIEQIQ